MKTRYPGITGINGFRVFCPKRKECVDNWSVTPGGLLALIGKLPALAQSLDNVRRNGGEFDIEFDRWLAGLEPGESRAWNWLKPDEAIRLLQMASRERTSIDIHAGALGKDDGSGAGSVNATSEKA